MSDDKIAIIEPEPTGAEAAVADLRVLVSSITNNPEYIQSLSEPELRTFSTVLLERMALSRQTGIGFHGQRDYYEVLGYNRLITYREFRAEYMRGGIAKRVVDAYPVAVWRGGAEVYEDEDSKVDTEFEKAFKALDQRLGIWSRLKRVHTLAELSTYAVLLIGAPGDLADPLPKGTPDQLLYLQPFSGGGGPGGGDMWDNRSRSMNADATIASFDTDPKSERFGQPETYQLKRTAVASPMLQRPVHWSRVIHVADGLIDDEVYGTPILEAIWNYLQDLLKVAGGGAEAFWLRANAGLHVDFDKTMGMPSVTPGKAGVPGVEPEERRRAREQAEHLQHQLQRVMVTRGAKVEQLSSATADFKNPADAIITLIAGTVGIPKRILVGSEMGQLASGQDKDNWNTQVQDKRTSWAFPSLVKPLVDRLVQYGYLPSPRDPEKFFVDWPVIEDLTEDEKAALALKMAEVNKAYGSTVFEEDEIRDKCFGMQPGQDELTDLFRAELAGKMTLVNKQQGEVVFTPTEIRKLCYGWAALKDDEAVPIGGPERITVTRPPPQPGDENYLQEEEAAVPPTKQPLAAQLAALEAAIEADDVKAVAMIIGVTI